MPTDITIGFPQYFDSMISLVEHDLTQAGIDIDVATLPSGAVVQSQSNISSNQAGGLVWVAGFSSALEAQQRIDKF